MRIDFSQMITAEAKAVIAASVRAADIKAECRARILAIGSETTQMNIAQAGIVFTAAVLDGASREVALKASGLREGDLGLARDWKAWVTSMQVECRRSIESGDDAVWPKVPDGVVGLAARF